MTLEITDDWLRRLAAGDPVITAEFFQRFGDAMGRLAQRNMGPRLRQRVDPEDIVQSACRTFLRRLQKGEFEFREEDDLWRLLCVVTLNKMRNQARAHSRLRRDASKEEVIDERVSVPTRISDDPAWIVSWQDTMSECLAELTPEQRKVLQMRVDGYSQSEIAVQLHCADRTVRRILTVLRERLKRHLNDIPDH